MPSVKNSTRFDSFSLSFRLSPPIFHLRRRPLLDHQRPSAALSTPKPLRRRRHRGQAPKASPRPMRTDTPSPRCSSPFPSWSSP
ncbi:hypothetical protein BC826DRAFT_986360 [Russula brevipes]|nr:hypothetical protein BC826DRAFT_986360 [Russula brevipes]